MTAGDGHSQKRPWELMEGLALLHSSETQLSKHSLRPSPVSGPGAAEHRIKCTKSNLLGTVSMALWLADPKQKVTEELNWHHLKDSKARK